MKLRYLTVIGIGWLSLQASVFAKEGPAPTSKSLQTQADKRSYTIGADIGKSLREQDFTITPMFNKGFDDAYNNKPLLMTVDEMKNTIVELQKEVIEQQQKKLKEMSSKNMKIGAEFLSKNKTKSGVVSLPSGLQYKIIKAGKGPSPTESSIVKVEYEGKLINGDVFDSTYKRGEPAEFQVNQVIPGWQEALQKMKTGAEWQLYIPAKLAYGERGFMNPTGVSIEPNETLIFKVHLLAILDSNDDKAAKKS